MAVLLSLLGGCSGKVGYLVAGFANPPENGTVTLQHGGERIYYKTGGNTASGKSPILFFLPTGCASLKYYMKRYLDGLDPQVRVYALQRVGVTPNATGAFGCSEDFHRHNHFPWWVDENVEFVRQILSMHEHDPSEIVVFGVSEAGNVALAIATQLPVTKVVVVGSGGLTQISELKFLAEKHTLDVDIDALADKVGKEPSRIDIQAYGQTYKYWHSVLYIDPLDFVRMLDIPLLFVIGELDEMVPVESVHHLRDFSIAHSKNNVETMFIPSADHRLIDRNGADKRYLVIDALNRWLADRRTRIPQ